MEFVVMMISCSMTHAKEAFDDIQSHGVPGNIYSPPHQSEPHGSNANIYRLIYSAATPDSAVWACGVTFVF